MSTETEKLMTEIRNFCHQRNISPAYFGLMAVNDGKFFDRLQNGKTCTLKTLEKARHYMGSQ